MSKLLISSRPLMVIPELAALIGLNEAMLLQQLHFWLQTSSHERDGRQWVYNTYEEWQDQFPFWSVSTIKRTMLSLEELGLVTSTDKYNTHKVDRTKWYAINYDHETLNDGQVKMTRSRAVQNDTLMSGSNWDALTIEKPETNKQRKTSSASGQGDTLKAMVTEFYAALGIDPPPNWSLPMRKAKELVAQGATPEDMKELVAYLKTQDWIKGGIDMKLASSQWEKFRQQRQQPKVKKRSLPIL